MDFVLPYPVMKPSPTVKTKFRTRSTKLSLKDKQKQGDSHKENEKVLPIRKIHQPKTTASPLKAYHPDLISSDESDHENNFLSESTLLFGSQFCPPKAESTRLESSARCSTDETNRASFFSCRSKLTPPISSDSGEQGACEESIICISDDESFVQPEPNENHGKVIPESTESDSTDKNAKVHQENTKNINKTIILETSSEDESIDFRKYIAGKTVLSQLNSASKDKPKQQRNIIIPTSSSDGSDNVIDNSVQADKANRNNCPPAANKSLKSKPFSGKIIIPETSDEENILEESPGISPRTLAAEKLSKTKVNDIQRWIDCNDATGFEKSDIETKDKKSSPPVWERAENGTSSDDSFDDLIRRNRNLPRKTPVKSSFIVDSSESSSSASFSNYRKVLTNDIRRDVNKIERTPLGIITGTARKGTVVRKPHKLLVDSSPETQSDVGSSSSSEWNPDFSRLKERGRKFVKKVGDENRFKPQSKNPGDLDFQRPDDTPKPFKKPGDSPPKPVKEPVHTPTPRRKLASDNPKPVKKPVGDTPRPRKKPVDSTPQPEKKTLEETPRTSSKPSKVEELKKSGTPYSPIRTFLTSLSGPPKDPNLRSHPEASVYFKNYKSKKEELAKRLFKLYNREVFDCRLPDDMIIEWNSRMVSTAGFCSCKMIRKPEETIRTAKIVLSTKILDSADRLRDTLIHELCHAAVWLLNNISGGHGPFWKAWAAKAEGRFPELPPIKRCHTYQIETKYTYRCTDCGYSFGRHSKSLNLQTKRCGHCYGTFEVLLNKQGRNQNGGLTTTPATPKPPTGFALFVKENYGSVKKEHSDKKHGDIMKLLGQKFAQVKIGQATK